MTAPTIKQVLTHLNTFRQNGDKVKFGFYTPEEDQLEELKEMCDKCKITATRDLRTKTGPRTNNKDWSMDWDF